MIFSSRIYCLLLFLSMIFFACEPSQYQVKEEANPPRSIQRYGQVIRIKLEKLDYYKELHANSWPCVVQKIQECNIRNYSIYLQDELLFAYFEYVGDDFTADMEKMAADTCTQRWWKETNICQEPIATAKEGDWWTTMEEVFHSE